MNNLTQYKNAYEDYRQRAYKSPRMDALREYFGAIAAGELQPPQKTIEVSEEFLSQAPELAEYHEIFQASMGHFYHHFCTSVPFVTEELYRLGLAICRVAQYLSQDQDRNFTCFNTTGEADPPGVTMTKFTNGLIRTLTNSPSPAVEAQFNQTCNPEYSKFYFGSFVDITPEFIDSQPEWEVYRGGFDFIHVSVTFQMYGSNRPEQIGYIKKLLKQDGLIFFMEKLKHSDPEQYQHFETIKDTHFKSKYYSSEEIEWKASTFLKQCVNAGQIDFETCVDSIKQHFKYAYLIWNSGNFYEFVASDNKELIETFLSFLVTPYVPVQFQNKIPMVREV